MFLASMLFATQAIAAECAALKIMSEQPKDLVAKKDNIQRSEWLLLEYLSSERSGKRAFDAEVARSKERAQKLVENMNELALLAAGQVEQGSAECAKFEQFKSDVEKMVSDREKEIIGYHQKFGFLYSCERISQSLLAHNKIMTSPDVSPQSKRLGPMTLDIGTGPFQMSARVTGAHMQEMTKQAEAPLDLEPQQRYAYFAFSCLKRYQKQEKYLKPPEEIQAQLKACPTTNWAELGMCVSKAAIKE